MNLKAPLGFCTLSLVLALGSSPLRADDSTPPAAPSSGQAPATDQTPPPDGGNGAPEQHHGRRQGGGYNLADLTQKLSLTADQQKQVGDILKSARQQGKALRDDDSLSKEDRWAKMRDIAKATHDQIRALLTADQQKIFDALPAPGRGGRQQGPAPTPTPTPSS